MALFEFSHSVAEWSLSISYPQQSSPKQQPRSARGGNALDSPAAPACTPVPPPLQRPRILALHSSRHRSAPRRPGQGRKAWFPPHPGGRGQARSLYRGNPHKALQPQPLRTAARRLWGPPACSVTRPAGRSPPRARYRTLPERPCGAEGIRQGGGADSPAPAQSATVRNRSFLGRESASYAAWAPSSGRAGTPVAPLRLRLRAAGFPGAQPAKRATADGGLAGRGRCGRIDV